MLVLVGSPLPDFIRAPVQVDQMPFFDGVLLAIGNRVQQVLRLALSL